MPLPFIFRFALPFAGFLFALLVGASSLSAQSGITTLDASRHLYSGVQVVGNLGQADRQVQIWRSLQSERATAEIVVPSFAPVAPDTTYFRWMDPSALVGRDYYYWIDVMNAGGSVIEQVGPVIGRRPLNVVDVSTWRQVLPAPENNLGNHDLRLLSHGAYTYLYGAGNVLRRSADGGNTWVNFTTGSVSFAQLVGGEDGVLHGVTRITDIYGEVWRSGDHGQTWAPVQVTSNYQAGQQGLPRSIYSIAFGGGRWVARGDAGYMFASTNSGATWVNLGKKFNSNQFGDLVYGQGKFILWQTNADMLYHSTDGNTWLPSEFDTGQNRNSPASWVVYTGSEFIACPSLSPNGAPQRLYRSTNLTSWTAVALTPDQRRVRSTTTPQVIAGRLYGTFGSQLVRTSNLSNISDWEIVDDNSYTSLIHTGTRFLGAGRGGFLAESTNGQSWVGISAPTNQNFIEILRSSSGWVAVPEKGAPLFSSNGSNWQRVGTPPSTRHLSWNAAVTGGGRFVLYGTYTYVPIDYPTNANGTTTFTFPLWQNVTETFLVSTDGVNWTEQQNVQNAQGALTTLTGKLFFNDSEFFALSVADRTKLMRSTDGRNWQLSNTSFTTSDYRADDLHNIFRLGANVFISGNSGNIFGSPLGFLNRAEQINGTWTTINRADSNNYWKASERPWGGKIWRIASGTTFELSSSGDGLLFTRAPSTRITSPAYATAGWFQTSGLAAFVAVRSDGSSGSILMTSDGENSAWYPVSADLGVPLVVSAGSTTEAVVAGGSNGRLYLASLPSVPTVSAPTFGSLTASTAVLGGNVAIPTGAEVVSRGVVFSKTAANDNPQIGGVGVNNLISPGTLGTFTVDVSGLSPGTPYVFKAYATNNGGIYYSVAGSFTTLATIPSLTLPIVTNITPTSAFFAANATSDGGATITGRGVVFSPTSFTNIPQIGGTGVTVLTTSGTTGVFNLASAILLPSTAYSLRAYATNSVGISYSTVVNFTTVSESVFLFNSWAASAGLAPSASTPEATPFGDGQSNLVKYAFNMNAGGPDVRILTVGGTSGLPLVTVDNSSAQPVLRVQFLRRIGSGLVYTPQRSTTLNGFSAMTGTLSVTPINSHWETVSVEGVSLSSKEFARVQVSLP